MKLIDEWRIAWTFLSVRIAIAVTGFGLLAPDTQGAILAWVGISPTRLPAVIGVLFIVGRMVKKDPQ